MPTDQQNNPLTSTPIPVPVPPSDQPVAAPAAAGVPVAAPVAPAAAPGTAGLSPLQAARSNLSNLSNSGLSAVSTQPSAPVAAPAPVTSEPMPAAAPVMPASMPTAPAAGMPPVGTPSGLPEGAVVHFASQTAETAPASVPGQLPGQLPSQPAPAAAPMTMPEAAPADQPAAPLPPLSPTSPLPETPAPMAAATPAMPAAAATSPVSNPLGTTAAAAPATSSVIPSVAPRAPGAEVQPPSPISEEQKVTTPKKEKKVDVVMIVLVVILVILIGVAAYLWYMNSQGKSVFAPQKSTSVVNEVVSEPEQTALNTASGSAGVTADGQDICYVDPGVLGQQEEVTDFVDWMNQSFTEVSDTDDGYYAWLFNYYIDRAAMTADLCHTHQYYCHINFAAKPKYAAQFTHFNQQRELEAQGYGVDYAAYASETDLQRLLMVDFNLKDVNFSDPSLGEGTIAPNGWQYSNAAGGLLTFGAYNPAAPDYSYRLSKVMTLDATGQVVLVGDGIATSSCKEDNNCVCVGSRMYLLLEKGETDELYFKDVFIEPLVGQFAQVLLEENVAY